MVVLLTLDCLRPRVSGPQPLQSTLFCTQLVPCRPAGATWSDTSEVAPRPACRGGLPPAQKLWLQRMAAGNQTAGWHHAPTSLSAYPSTPPQAPRADGRAVGGSRPECAVPRHSASPSSGCCATSSASHSLPLALVSGRAATKSRRRTKSGVGGRSPPSPPPPSCASTTLRSAGRRVLRRRAWMCRLRLVGQSASWQQSCMRRRIVAAQPLCG